MVKAVFNGKVIAESNDTVVVEGNHYFPEKDVHEEYLEKSDHHTECIWKGRASYYHVKVDDQRSENAAWYYPDPKPGARKVKDRIAFWKDVKVE